ncbi:cyclic pyranopterin monophosphate synthase MoaC [Alkalibacter mobilis]|uniref:cyclic pyranopterin monophosphate synthase MoaC n=1 Tax=Alkalibacter mobilis TaxID=2787712 RepID=UPI00189C8B55|nr:cyclic pyranopterin monophosphate synthase MoaC [Alkalibacter mobilis]MBF7096968.1 cyclic pyranopterin monophosphate synthase MoaC [Alkalibacter mobilis]
MGLSHVDEKGNARMVDVSGKIHTERVAVASGRVRMKEETIEMIHNGTMPKGDVLATARIAGIMGAKQTYKLIPMCHNMPIDGIKVDIEVDREKCAVNIKATAVCVWKTGIEMEALTAVSVAALTLYDMCKAVDKSMVIEDVKLLKKTGGKSGEYNRVEEI